MIDKIKEILESNSKISDYVINTDTCVSKELFFIKHKLDMVRGTENDEITLRIYVDFEEGEIKYRGFSQVVIGASDNLSEIKEKIESAVFAAGFVKNRWFPLPENENNDIREVKAFKNLEELNEKIEALKAILFKEYSKDAKVNSCEIFAKEGNRRTISSKGTDISYPYSEFLFELVTDSNAGKEPVEIFNEYYMTNMDLKEVEKIVRRQIIETEGRSRAVRNRKIDKINVILNSDDVADFFRYYVTQASAGMVFNKISRVKLNENFQGENSLCPLNIEMNPYLESAVNRKPVDDEGKKLERFTLYKNGTPLQLNGGARFTHYLDIENMGIHSCFEVEGGKHSKDEYLRGAYLEILAFSSFLMDGNTGDFGGEFRLARLVEDGKITYVTGGSISLNISKVQDLMEFTKETRKTRSAVVPEMVIIKDVTVSGD